MFRAQFLVQHLRKVMLNAANFDLFWIIHTKFKYIYRSFVAIIFLLNYFIRFLNFILFEASTWRTGLWRSRFKCTCSSSFWELGRQLAQGRPDTPFTPQGRPDTPLTPRGFMTSPLPPRGVLTPQQYSCTVWFLQSWNSLLINCADMKMNKMTIKMW